MEPHPAPADEVRWGILATGKIARNFAADLVQTPGARLVAVGSRSLASAEEFCAALPSRPGEPDTTAVRPRAYGSYAELLADDEVDVVYVATPHALHRENCLDAFAAGKHVLCEKPLTLDTATAAEVFAAAAAHDRFVMEAMWMATHPLIRDLRRRLAAGEFGRPRHLHAELGFVADVPAEHRLLDPALGASALLDMGIYPLTLAHLLLGEPEELAATAHLTEAGIDSDVAIAGRYRDGASATLTASITSWSSRTAALATDTGRLEIHADFHSPRQATWTPREGGGWGAPVELTPPEPVIGRGYGNEAAEVIACLREGRRTSALVPPDQTLALMAQLDRVRSRIGVDFPG